MIESSSTLISNEDEQQQIMAAQKDLKAFAPLYSKYHGPLCRFAYQRLQSKEEAFEIVAISFCKALQNIGKYKNIGAPLGSWLYRIVLNELNQQHRKSKTQRVINCENDSLLSIAEELPNDFEKENFEVLKKALTYLKVEELDLIEMRFFEKRTFKEMAEILNQQEAATKMKLYRVLEKLKKIMTK